MMKKTNDKKSAKDFIDPDIFEKEIGINLLEQGEEFVGYLCNLKPHRVNEEAATEKGITTSCLLLFFFTENPDDRGNCLKKCVFNYEPYFYLIVKADIIDEFQQFISKRFEGKIATTEIVEKNDLDMVNHLSGIKLKTIKLNFKNIANLVNVRNALRPIVQKNKTKEKVLSYSELLNPSVKIDLIEMVQDLREDDVPYHVRCCIDNEIRCGFWYKVTSSENGCSLQQLSSKLSKPPLTVLAYDIETTKAPLKFPDPRYDSVMLISYMIDGDGYLITNRAVISEDIQDFQYTPKPEFDGHFQIFNENDEENLLKRFILHCKERRPNIFVTFNGDYFDIPFLLNRMKVYGLSMEAQMGIVNTTISSKAGEGEYMGRFSVHIDCLYWVKRDAFLPQGSHGLKAVTKAKLGYDPIEIDPEKMLKSAQETPQQLCAYSVSDALATYYLYKLMIHDFIFALCTIIPTFPDEVLRKGSGTLCEELLMAQAYRRNILFPNKQVEEFEKFFQGHLIDTETYIGGHVECLNVGVYRNDIPVKFQLDPNSYDMLIGNVSKYIGFSLQVENNQAGDITDLENFDSLCTEIKSKLTALKEMILSSNNMTLEITSSIYHLDVGAMYPNIILTNRLQPVSVVNEQICAGCLYNREENKCKKILNWKWRGELFPLSRSEYENLKHQYEFELLNTAETEQEIEELTVEDYRKKFIKRIKNYCSKVYKQIHLTKVELKEDIVCMRENSFYVDTVRDFRDRRYEFKYLVKVWKGKIDEARAAKDHEGVANAKNMMDLYESLQLAHKIILNSFYGYVMRRGARWHSMEMAAMVTHIGSNIITDSRELCEKIGKPLELDTDGIWCLLPTGFPELFQLKLKNGKKLNFSFPCSMLNCLIYEKYSNNQFQIKDPKAKNIFLTKKEMSIFFEVDGPYRCMVLPAAKEEGKMLKKRYAVFGLNGKLHELKGFELKRRGELKIIKIFQSEVFEQFLKGKSLKECYLACAEIADRWFSILETEANGINDEELLEYIEESRVMSKSLPEYGAQKSTSITCAKRLAEILGNELLKDKGLCAKYIISKKPIEAPVAERAVPTIVFHSDSIIRKKLLRKWLNDYTIEEIDMRDVIDWDYYKERLSGNILKIIIIPAAIQKIENPFPKIPYPDWVNKLMQRKNDDQRNLKYFFKNVSNVDKFMSINEDIEKLDIKKKGNASSSGEIESPKGNKTIKPKNILTVSQQKKKGNLDKFLEEGKKKLEYEAADVEMTPVVEKEDSISISISINLLQDFSGWLKQQKRKWKKISTNPRKINNPQQNSQSQKSSHLQFQFLPGMKSKENAFKTSNIKIIQIIEHNTPGYLKLWVTFDQYLECITLYLKRKIFINSHKIDVPSVFHPVKLILPRNKPLLNLYEFEIDEKEFKEKFNNFNDYIIDPSIEGIYESKVPILYHLIKDYGCQFKFSNKSKRNLFATNSVFNVEDFEPRSVSSNNEGMAYMSDEDYSKLYIYHSNLGARHFVAMFIYPIKKVYVYIVHSIAKNLEVPNVKKMIENTLKEYENDTEADSGAFIFDFDVITKIESDIRTVMKNLNKILSDLKYSTSVSDPNAVKLPPGLLILQSCYSPNKLIQTGLTCVYNEYPIMEIPFHSEENNFPALDWIKFALKKLVFRYVDLTSIMEFRVQLSRYCNIPICNLELDAGIYCSDILFSRVLKSSKQVIWYSPSGFPDLGGGTDSHDFLGEVEYEFPKILNPGMYIGYSAEVDIGLFCVNAILESDHMKDLAGKYELTYVDKGKDERNLQCSSKKGNLVFDYHLERDEFVLGSNAFIVIKKMVEKLLNDVKQYENICADYLLVHFYRWVASFNSKFFDPVIHRMINKLMYKYFSILVRKIKEFGFDIIYADYKKIFLFNSKSNFNDFQASIDYLFRTIKKIQIFNHITLTPNTFWKIILFKDSFNYAGINAKMSDTLAESEGGGGGDILEDDVRITDISRQNPKVISKWTLAEFLPPILEKDFLSLISDYLIKLYRFFFLKDYDMVANLRNLYLNTHSTLHEARDFLNGEGSLVQFKQFLVNDYLSTKVFNIIPNIMKKREGGYEDDEMDYAQEDREAEDKNDFNMKIKVGEDDDGQIKAIFSKQDFMDDSDDYDQEDDPNHKKIQGKQANTNTNTNTKSKQPKPSHKNKNTSRKLWEFPIKLGSYTIQKHSSLPLEYVKYITAILELDADVALSSYVLKKNCLKLIQVEEFSKETEFQDPCRTFILHDVICEFCSNTKDIDFSRDKMLIAGSWACDLCNAHYDKQFIEYLIIHKVKNVIDYYFNQDLKCKKCKNQKNENIFTICECAGEFVKTYEENIFKNVTNINTIEEYLSNLTDIANFYSFENLKAMLSYFK